ncbi:hypothetical protein [Synechococcus sp. MIT S9451]|uniref:hypothetical protein n=1 Tax=Synechococcus sp. MIT S9451 TaxID=3082543 RepID=UPI0039B4DC5E
MTELEKSEKDAKRAGVNLVVMGVLHLFFAFFASLGYAIYLDYWKPFLVATLTAIVSIVAAAIVGGILGAVIGAAGGSDDAAGLIGLVVGVLFGYIAPLASFLIFRIKVLALRDRIGSV